MDKPRVKPLVWSGSESDCYMQATTIIGQHCIGVMNDGWYAEFEAHSERKPFSLGWYYKTAEAAKAAAQADYEARILAALAPVTVRTCAKCGHPENNHPYRHPFVSIAQKGADSG